MDLVEQVGRRLRRQEIKGRTVDLKVRFADFKTISRSLTLPQPTNITQELLKAGMELMTRLPPVHLPVRLLGFGVSGLDHPGASQQQLFGDPERDRHRQLDRVADEITEKFRKRAIRRSAGMERNDG